MRYPSISTSKQHVGNGSATWSRASAVGNGLVVSSHSSSNRAAFLRTKARRASPPTQ
jgi:hypothetical protein